MKNLIGYINRPSVIHSLTGAAKLICMLLWSTAVMLTYDTRVLAVLLIMGLITFVVSKSVSAMFRLCWPLCWSFCLSTILLSFSFRRRRECASMARAMSSAIFSAGIM